MTYFTFDASLRNTSLTTDYDGTEPKWWFNQTMSMYKQRERKNKMIEKLRHKLKPKN